MDAYFDLGDSEEDWNWDLETKIFLIWNGFLQHMWNEWKHQNLVWQMKEKNIKK